MATPGLNPRFITDIFSGNYKSVLFGGEGVQICMLEILSMAKPQGHKQICKNLITFVSISWKHLVRGGLELLLVMIDNWCG